MCDLNCDNLIDLSFHDEASCSNTESKAQTSEYTPQFVPPSWGNRKSLENNPFDSVQILADRLNDPFNIAESEACMKAKHSFKEPAEIEVGNLLSLSGDNLLNDDQEMPTACLNDGLGIIKLPELDLESPPVALNENHQTDSVSEIETTPTSSGETTASAKLKKNMEYRKRLLKLSISNSAFNSPAFQKEFKELGDIFGTPGSSIFSKAAEFGENLLSSESPLKLIDDEDKLTKELQTLADLEEKFAADLEMLKIPILNELPSPDIEHAPVKSDEPDVVDVKSPLLKNSLTDLETIKSKLKAKKSKNDCNNRHEISNLIENLKALISRGEMVNERKQQASELLESLSSALNPSNIEEEPLQNTEMLAVPPQPIIRQGTFDLDIQEKEEMKTDKQEAYQEMPKCMVSSSATYDGETPMEKQDLNLPEIAPLSPRNLASPNLQSNSVHNNINDIVEQLSKLLINNSGDDQTHANNPTLIVVMNTNQLSSPNIDDYKCNVGNANARSAYVANYLESSINDNSPDLVKVNSVPRRRSQSLSLHDKIKVVRIPLQAPTLRPMQEQHSTEKHETPPILRRQPSNEKEMPDFKTPAKFRRNSYSSGTPYTAQVGLRKTGSSAETKRFSQMRRAQTLDTHHESQQHAIARPLSNNLTTFKPDLKKKVKTKIESILKSSGPLKATIPVRKLAPILKASPPTPERKIKSEVSGAPTTPIPSRLLKSGAEIGYPNACSTPAAFDSPLKRTTGPINRPRYSYISTTPNPKSSLTNTSTGSLKRRTIAELKAKSPLKSRMSNSGLQIPSSSRVSSGSSRLSISAGARASKTPIKTATNTASTNPSIRLSSRVSVGGTLLSNKNKENKRL